MSGNHKKTGNSVPFGNETSAEAIAPYSALAPFYDRMMSHVNYGRWAEYLETILRREGYFNENLLDIGCGTGSFLREMHKRGWRVAGVDPSPQMLEISRKRLPDVPLEVDRLPELSSVKEGGFGVVTCLFDTMNYLLDLSLFEEALATVYRLLPASGIFLFDLVGEENCKNYFNNYTENEVINDDLAYSRFCYYDRKNRLQTNKIQLFTPDGIYEEIHHQTIYPFRRIEKLIRRRRQFKILGIFEDFSFDLACPRSGRAHFVLRKEQAE